MRAARLIAACVFVAAGAGAAAAQPAEPPAGSASASTTPATASSTTAPAASASTTPPTAPAPRSTVYDRRDDAGWTLYHEAFRELLRGRRARARELFQRLEAEHPDHPATVLVRRAPPVRDAAHVRRKPVEEATTAASAELALFQTLHGIAFGVELCFVFECNSLTAFIGLPLLGGGTGAIASLKAFDRLTSGQRALLNSGTAWGAINAFLALAAVEPDDDRTVALSLIAGQGAGIAAGAWLFSLRPTAGQVALANSGGQWAGALMGLALATADPDNRQLAPAILVGADVGLGVGAYLAKLWPDVSRAQSLVIDAGGIAGVVGGGGLGVLISGAIESRTTTGIAALGAALGLGAAAYFTRGWADSDDGDGDGPHAVISPAEHGRGGTVGFAGTW